MPARAAIEGYTRRQRYSPESPLDFLSFIVSKKATAGPLPQGLASEDFSSGKGTSGTGPFKFVRFQRDDRVELERFDGYWGPKPAWTKVTLRFIAADPTRVAALLSGDVDAIENVPTSNLKRIRENQNLNFFSKVSHRVIYFNLDQRDKTSFVFDADGMPLDRNPLKDIRVRKALSMAINRDAIKDRVMEGLSLPTANLMPPALFGHNPTLKPVYDADGAKKLLAEASYPNGLSLTFHGPNNRYVNDDQIMQTVAQMWARIGVKVKVDAMPLAVYFPRGTKKEFSVTLVGWGAQTGEVSSPLRSLLACENKEKGFGVINYPSYCNPKMDALLEEGLHNGRRPEAPDVVPERGQDRDGRRSAGADPPPGHDLGGQAQHRLHRTHRRAGLRARVFCEEVIQLRALPPRVRRRVRCSHRPRARGAVPSSRSAARHSIRPA